MKILLVLSVFFLFTVSVAQVETVFSGSPEIKVSEGGIERTPDIVSAKDATNLKCIISKIGDKYYWASRENKELIRFEAGAFITFVSPEGVGYVRIINSESKAIAALTSATEERFDYVEHLLIGLKSVTYYGIASQ